MVSHRLFYIRSLRIIHGVSNMTGKVSDDHSWMLRSQMIVHAAFYSKGCWYLLVFHQMTEVTHHNSSKRRGCVLQKQSKLCLF